ncbi:hypothetical protein GIB67_002803 [Kingdonia uniflora]|uniref:NB-ARC domain-containing protein n=1 Tax=Kingdonia uniflora TaxID=39325 RepID=A0A7J7M554_9MAGN|nr:hypothetical protein GIB67_002803 [Kingdonia uniflora]
MLKRGSASGTTGSGEVEGEAKKRRVDPSSKLIGTKVIENRPGEENELKVAEDRARLVARNDCSFDEGDLPRMEEEKAELEKGKAELEKKVARLKLDLAREGKRLGSVKAAQELKINELTLEVGKNLEEVIVEVDKFREEVAELYRQAGKFNSYFKGWGSARYRLGKDSKKKIVIAYEFLIEGRRFNSVATRVPIPQRVVEHFNDFASREPTKTTLVKEACEEVKKQKPFDKVVLATVSQNLDLRGIQTHIAESLGMKIEEDNMPIRATRLSEMWEKNIILVLDEVWMRLELAPLGIIPRGDEQKTQNSCKVLITSRSLDVYRSMETTKSIEIQLLSERDSQELFRQNVGTLINYNTLHKMSEDIINVCEGLPFAILAFARGLRDKDETAWPDIFEHIRKSLFEGMSLFDNL